MVVIRESIRRHYFENMKNDRHPMDDEELKRIIGGPRTKNQDQEKKIYKSREPNEVPGGGI